MISREIALESPTGKNPARDTYLPGKVEIRGLPAGVKGISKETTTGNRGKANGIQNG